MIGNFDHRKPLYIILLFLVVIGLSISKGTITCQADVVDRVLAIVNEDIITLSDLNLLYMPYLNDIKERGYGLEQQRELLFKAHGKFLDEIIRQKLTDQAIKRSKVGVAEKQIVDEIARIKSAYDYSDAEFIEALQNQGLTLDGYRRRLEERILRENLINLEVVSKIVITPGDIKAYYEKHADLYAGKKQYHLRNIIMPVAPYDEEEFKRGIRQKMELVLERLKKGQSFETLAKTYSESPFAAEGGDLGLFNADQLSLQIQEALKGLKVGEYTSILDTEQGYQIFFIENIVSAQGKSLKEATPEIQEKVYKTIVDQKFQKWLENLHKRSHIKIMK
ncbi:MAG: peptidylprolyl isomerase [Desulfobacterales bacterium]